MGDLRFQLLGPMEVSFKGKPVTLPAIGERALLAQLLLEPGRTVASTVLIDRLWSDSNLPTDPMNALQIRVSKLRRGLKRVAPSGVVVRAGAGYRADVAPADVDAVAFVDLLRSARSSGQTAGTSHAEGTLEAYDRALALWRGEPLSDFGSESWATVEALRLSEFRTAALTERAQVALSLGRHPEVVADLEPLVAEKPTQEALVGLLMTALYRSGRQADALEVYRRTRLVLDEELGLEPSMTLRSLHERVLRQDESLGAVSDHTTNLSTAGPARRAHARLSAPTNLPTVARPLVGRDADLDTISELLDQTRMLTLIGPGGAGKTSLALAAVVRVAQRYPDGVFGVRLAAVRTVSDVPLAIADALGVPLDGAAAERDLSTRVAAFVASRRLLLLLDNCEHVIDAAASMVDQLLGRCPDLTVLATSREALAVPDEVQLTIAPLATPPDDAAADHILQYPAAQLFAQRARATRPATAMTPTDVEAIGHITRALDGIPLALELAAARVTTMSLTEIANRLGHRFSILTSGARTAEARQQTLRATVDWSYALLSDEERRVFSRLSVFQGGWTLTAAEAVVGDDNMVDGQVLNVVARLAERSMLVAEAGAPTRYRMLETLREYAVEKLAQAEEDVLIARRHAMYYTNLAAQAEAALKGQGQRAVLAQLHAEQPNIRAALAHLRSPEGDADSALLLAGSLGLYWHLGRHLEGREVLGELLKLPSGSPQARALALQAESIVERPRACLVHPSPLCSRTAEESLKIFDQLGDHPRAALSRVLVAVEGVTGADRVRSEQLLREAGKLFAAERDSWGEAVIGFVRMETALKAGDAAAAVPLGRSTAMAFRQLDDPWGLSAVLYHLGWGLRQFGRYEEAARVLEEAIDVAEGAGLYNTVQWALADLGVTQVHLGHLDSASDLFERAASASENVGDGAGRVLADYGYGLLHHVAGQWREARNLYASAHTGFDALQTPVPAGVALAGVARCDEADGDQQAARGRYAEALETGRRVREPGLVATALEGLARLDLAKGDHVTAQRLLGEAATVRAESCRPAAPHERADLMARAGADTATAAMHDAGG